MSDAKATEPKGKGGSELFYVDENGKKQDAWLHDEILSGGTGEAEKVSAEVAKRLGIDLGKPKPVSDPAPDSIEARAAERL